MMFIKAARDSIDSKSERKFASSSLVSGRESLALLASQINLHVLNLSLFHKNLSVIIFKVG